MGSVCDHQHITTRITSYRLSPVTKRPFALLGAVRTCFLVCLPSCRNVRAYTNTHTHTNQQRHEASGCEGSFSLGKYIYWAYHRVSWQADRTYRPMIFRFTEVLSWENYSKNDGAIWDSRQGHEGTGSVGKLCHRLGSLDKDRNRTISRTRLQHGIVGGETLRQM